MLFTWDKGDGDDEEGVARRIYGMSGGGVALLLDDLLTARDTRA